MKSMLFAALAALILVPSSKADEALIAVDAPLENSMIGTQWVQADATGMIAGTIATGVDPVNGQVSLARTGSKTIVAQVDSTGHFSLPAPEPGVYTLMYQAESSFAAFALQIVGADSGNSVQNSIVVSAASLSPLRALSTIARYQPIRVTGQAELGKVADLALPSGNVKTGRYQVVQSDLGGLNGRLLRAGASKGSLWPAVNANVMIIQGDEIVAQAVTTEEGTFEIKTLPVGTYNLIASGDSGFAVVGFELIGDEPVARGKAGASDIQFVSTTVQPPASGFEAMMAPPSTDVMGFAGPPATSDEDQGAPVAFDPMGGPGAGAGGGFGGGGGGFGGGGAGGGGIGGGGGLGLAAAGGIIAAIIASDNNDDLVPTPASPAIP